MRAACAGVARLSTLVLGLVFVCTAAGRAIAAPSDARVTAGFSTIAAGEQLATIHRGMNVLDADPVWSDPARAVFQLRHLARIHDAGFDTVRLNLHAFAHSDSSGRIDAAWLTTLDGYVN